MAAAGGQAARLAPSVRLPLRGLPPGTQSAAAPAVAEAGWITNQSLAVLPVTVVSSARPGRVMHCGIASRVTKSPATLGRVVLRRQAAAMQHSVRGGHRSSVEMISRTSVVLGVSRAASPGRRRAHRAGDAAAVEPGRAGAAGRVGAGERLGEGRQRGPRVEHVARDEVHGRADVLLPVGELGLAPEGVAAGREEAVDGPAHDEGDGHGDHQLDEAESAFVSHHGAPGHPPVVGSELVQERNDVNSARDRAPARAPVPSERTRRCRSRRSASVVIHQCVWMTPTPCDGVAAVPLVEGEGGVVALLAPVRGVEGGSARGEVREGDGLQRVHGAGGRGDGRRALVGDAVRAGGDQHEVGHRHEPEDEHDDGDEGLDQREAGLAGAPAPLTTRVVHVSVPHGWGSTRPPGAMRTVRSRDGRGLLQADLDDPGGVSPDVEPVLGGGVDHRGLARQRAVGHRDGGQAGPGRRGGVAEPAQPEEAQGGPAVGEGRGDEHDPLGQRLHPAQPRRARRPSGPPGRSGSCPGRRRRRRPRCSCWS